MAYQLILASLWDMFSGDDCPDMDDLLEMAILECGVPSFSSVGILKDKGNVFFKMGNVPLAYFHYKIALKFLLLMGTPSKYDEPSATSLALSIYLNLAACDLKVPDYEQVCCYCTLILFVDPSNTKALYRRGLAFKHLNLLPKAVADFECALKYNPHNKDITRELQDVIDRLAINSNGKRESPQFAPLDIERRGKKPLISSVSSDDCVPVSLSTVPMEFESIPAPCEVVNPTVFSDNSKSSKLIFANNKKPSKELRLSSEDYDRLMNGKNLEFFHHRSMSFFRVRALTSKTIQTGTPLEEISGTAEVPTSSSLSENFDTIIDVTEAENATLVEENVFIQAEKKMRISSVSPHGTSHVSSVSYFKFQFAAVRSQLSFSRRRKEDHPHVKGRRGRVFTTSKKRSLVSVNVSTSVCRFAHSTITVKRCKRKKVQSIEFDAHFHPPLKKSRIFSSHTTSASFSSVIVVSSGVSNPLCL